MHCQSHAIFERAAFKHDSNVIHQKKMYSLSKVILMLSYKTVQFCFNKHPRGHTRESEKQDTIRTNNFNKC